MSSVLYRFLDMTISQVTLQGYMQPDCVLRDQVISMRLNRRSLPKNTAIHGLVFVNERFAALHAVVQRIP